MILPFPRQLVLGHRGSPREATENTLRSFALALRAGADGVELDVRPSVDRVPVVIHDDSLRRTMAVGGRVSRLHWPAIERVTQGSTPSLAQAVAWAAASGAWLNVEIKAPGVEESVLDIIARARIGSRVVISSFHVDAVQQVGRLDPDIARYLLTERWDTEATAAVERAGAAGVCLRFDAADGSTLDDLRRRNLPVIAWTVNDSDEMRRLLGHGVAAIISDLPATAAAIRDEVAGCG
jgi:glycerophosphoryl diester phosphodiesterase